MSASSCISFYLKVTWSFKTGHQHQVLVGRWLGEILIVACNVCLVVTELDGCSTAEVSCSSPHWAVRENSSSRPCETSTHTALMSRALIAGGTHKTDFAMASTCMAVRRDPAARVVAASVTDQQPWPSPSRREGMPEGE